ncbi:MAG: hemerythrin domain-containing protein [Nanoarchaeota archaeon]
MQAYNIINLFVEDHNRITELLDIFTGKKTKHNFNNLKKALEKHFVEEELLYSRYKYKTGEIIPVLQTVGKEHSNILEILKKIEAAVKKIYAVGILELYALLERHKNMENRLLYPELDKVITDKEKEEVYWSIKMQ